MASPRVKLLRKIPPIDLPIERAKYERRKQTLEEAQRRGIDRTLRLALIQELNGLLGIKTEEFKDKRNPLQSNLNTIERRLHIEGQRLKVYEKGINGGDQVIYGNPATGRPATVDGFTKQWSVMITFTDGKKPERSQVGVSSLEKV